MDAGQVALQIDAPVGRITGDAEQLGQGELPVAMVDRSLLDLGQRFVAKPVGNNALDLDGNGAFSRGISGSATSISAIRICERTGRSRHSGLA